MERDALLEEGGSCKSNGGESLETEYELVG